MADILDRLPPVLELIYDPEEEQSFDFAPSPADASAPEPAASVPAFHIDRSSPETAGAVRRKTPIRRQSAKSPAWEVAKIALGGIAGLAIAQLLLWWMPWENLRRDPFDVGPAVARYAPWLVPANFRGAAPAADAEAAVGHADRGAGRSATGLPERTFEGVDAGTGRSDGEGPGPSEREFRPADGAHPPATDADAPDAMADLWPPIQDMHPQDMEDMELPSTGVPDDLDDLYDLGPTLSGPVPAEIDPALELDPDFELDPGLETDPGLELDPELEMDPELETDPELDVDGLPETAPGLEGNEPAAALASALQDSRAAAEAWFEATPEETRLMLVPSYRAFARLSEAVTHTADDQDADHQAAVQLLQSLRHDAAKVEELGKAGIAWFNAPDRRDSEGVLLVGVVTGISQQGALYRTEVALPDSRTVAPVYHETDPHELYAVEDRVLVAGAIIPSANLPAAQHHRGADPFVVWGPIVAVVPD